MGKENPLEFDRFKPSDETTGSASSGGGTVEGSITLGVQFGVVVGLSVVANGNTVQSTIEFFADSSRADKVYEAVDKDFYTAPFVDASSWMANSFDNNLDGDLYYRVTNDGANASTYTIGLVGIGTYQGI